MPAPPISNRNNHTWKFNVNDPDAEYQWHNYWRNIIHAISHWIEYRKFGDEAKIHNLNSFIMEKSIAKYIYERKWHMGTLVRETKPKPVIDKNTLRLIILFTYETSSRLSEILAILTGALKS